MFFRSLSHHPIRPILAVVLLSAALHAAAASPSDFPGSTYPMPYDDDPIHYSKSIPTGAVADLQAQMEKGKAALPYEKAHGYLIAVLKALKIPISSQMLVFSKTSFQRDLISPGTPRALYFNDNTYVGFIPGAPYLEVSTVDPNLGGVFYTVDQFAPGKPHFVRHTQCLECHATSNTMGVPGHLVRSFSTSVDGSVDYSTGVGFVDSRTPLADRWGGWYVTGTSGRQTHLGNLIGPAAIARHQKNPSYSTNLTSLKGLVDTSRYLAPSSDIVALMVLEHQTHMHDYITRLNYEARTRIMQYGQVKYLNGPINAFLKYLLFTEETPLTGPVKGTSGFAAEFEKRGPFDHKGRSLRQFDLKTRLFKYPCSYLIYSDAFQALPPALKAIIYQRLWDILTGKDTSADFKKLESDRRQAILEILTDTLPNLPAYWTTAPGPVTTPFVAPAATPVSAPPGQG